MSQTMDPGPLQASSNESMLALLGEASALAADLAHKPLDEVPDGAARIQASVIRPLSNALDQAAGEVVSGGRPAHGLSAARRLHELALAATIMRGQPGAPPEVVEATAALQEMALQIASAAGPEAAAACLSELSAPMAQAPTGIQAMTDGPYLVTNATQLSTYLGASIPVRPQIALCRCGASARKPWCDGSHARVGFTGKKDPKRVPDRRDTYRGQQVTVLDNRGICAHSGFCTDRLPSVFHAGSEPFVTPSGGRMDEIVRVARNCPSGALSYAVDGKEARDQVDHEYLREPAIEVSKDGPYRVSGGIPLVDGQGEPEKRVDGASLEHYSLCRCGQSQNKPFCSGMHYYVNFTDPVPDPDHEFSLFEWVGGLPALLRTTRIFYEKHVPQDPLLAPLFANMAVDHPERVACWLGEVFGGPKLYSERYGGYPRMIAQHAGKHLTEEHRKRWAALMYQSMDDAGLPNDAEFRAAYVAYIEWGTRLAVENSQDNSRPPQGMPVPRWWWVCDATPWARVSALAPVQDEEKPVALPGPDEPVGYSAHIKHLFRSRDRQSMRFAFDLWSYDDVTRHADGILHRLRAGTMPCDGAWPSEKVDVFERWVESGKPE